MPSHAALRQYAIPILVACLAAVDIWLGLDSRWWRWVVYIVAIISETMLLAVWLTMQIWTWRVPVSVLGLAGLIVAGAATHGHENFGWLMLTIVAATAAWPLPARFCGIRVVRLPDERRNWTSARNQSLREWFLSIAVVAVWIAILKGELIPSDRIFTLTTSLATYLGFRIMLAGRSLPICIAQYAAMQMALACAALLLSAEAAVTLNRSAPPMHGDLAPIWSPVEFVRSRLAALRYLDTLNVGVIWLGTYFCIVTSSLSVLRYAGYRIANVPTAADETSRRTRDG